MKQRIVGFHQDQAGDWVAELACGHGQHVRHNPPLSFRPWVLTSEGRERFLGYELECPLCEGTIDMTQTTKLDLFAGIPVADYAAALKWYERLLGSPPAFFPHDTEAVWELAEHRYVYIVQQPEHAGHARHTLFVDDLDTWVTQIADRGLDPAEQETYSNGVRKITYRDPDGNEIGFGGAPR